MTECPRVMGPSADGTPGILKEMVLWDQDTFWLKPKYLRRGRLVEAAATIIAQGQTIEESWWSRASGEREDDRVEHEEVRPYIEGVRQFLDAHAFVLEQSQLHVVNDVERYQGHLDWTGFFRGDDHRWIIDLKCGRPPDEWITAKVLKDGVESQVRRRNPLFDAYKLQTVAYGLAYRQQHGVRARRAALHLYDGHYSFREYRDWHDESVFLRLARAYHDRERYRRIG